MNLPTILVYTVAWCPHCVRILSFLDSLGISYQNYDVDFDDARWKEALALTGGVDIVPVIKIGQASRHGSFSPDFEAWIKKHLGK